eukprot:687766-Rhodomonas_salina.1
MARADASRACTTCPPRTPLPVTSPLHTPPHSLPPHPFPSSIPTTLPCAQAGEREERRERGTRGRESSLAMRIWARKAASCSSLLDRFR